MGRQKPEASVTTWADIAECIPAWETEKGVRIEAIVRWEATLQSGAYVEVVILDADFPLQRVEIARRRAPFPTRKGSGQAGAVLHAVFQALVDIDNEPWQWSGKMRREATRTA